MKLYWLPFVITDTGLLAAIFLSSCRNLALHGCQAEANHDYSQIATMYKLECIRSVNAAIAAERPIINETIIAITLLLCADEVSLHIFLEKMWRDTISNGNIA